MYRLHKLLVDDDVVSAVPVGYATTGNSLSIFSEDKKPKSIDSIFDIEIGKQILLTRGSEYHRTSKVSEIIFQLENKIIFKTQTSYYELEELKDE